MASAIYFDPVAIAVEICNRDSFKTEVFSALYPDEGTPQEIKSCWDEKVEDLAYGFLGFYNLGKDHQELVVGAVFPIAWRILEWIEFHAGTFSLTRDFCIEFLEQSLFTSRGIIDHRRVKAKMSEKSLNNLQKFQLACFYCDYNNIPPLFRNLSDEERKFVYNEDPGLIKQSDIVKFWSYYIMGEIDKLRETDKIDQCRTKNAIISGSQLAIDYCLGRTKSKQSYEVDIAASIFRHRMYIEITSGEYMNTIEDWVIFRQKRYSCTDEYWVPRSFYADMFYSLFANMCEKQTTDFWDQIFEKRFVITNKKLGREEYGNLLAYFLCWPYQEMFSELLKTSWHQLPFQVFNAILLKLAKRIEPKKGEFFYGEEKFYDYRRILMDEWTKCSQIGKRYLHQADAADMLLLFESIYSLETFNEIDRRNIKSILQSATEKERRYYMLSNTGFLVCLRLLETKKYDSFDELVSFCFTAAETAKDYRLRVIISNAIRKNCLTNIKNEELEEAEEKFRWSGYPLSEEEILYLKNILIHHNDGKETCIEIWKTDPPRAERFITWCVPSEEENFRKGLIFSDVGQEACRKLCVVDSEKADRLVSWCLPPDMIENFKYFLVEHIKTLCTCTKYVIVDNTPELANKLVRWCLPEEKAKELKRALGLFKIEVFPEFKSTIEDVENCTDDEFPDKIYDWEKAQNMFNWCFENPDDVKEFKEKYVSKFKREIIYKCISSNNWNAADRFLSWLKLDEIDLRVIKKEQIFSDGETKELLNMLLSKNADDEIFAESGGKQRTIERFVHWFLVDDGSTVTPLTRWLERFGDDSNIDNIVTKLKASDDLETIRELLKTF